MEKKLRTIFEYQRFARNKRLENMLSEAENSMVRELNDEELSLAAGGAHFDEDVIFDGLKKQFSENYSR